MKIKGGAFFRIIVFIILPLLVVIAAGAGWYYHQHATLADLERQLVLAQHEGNTAACVELTQRLLRLKPTPTRQLALATSLLEQGAFAQAELVAKDLLQRAPEFQPQVLRLHAQVGSAQKRGEYSLQLWLKYLETKPALKDRVSALDDIVALHLEARDWDQARLRVEERLTLDDQIQARITRARIAIHQRRWTEAQADFRQLKALASGNEELRDLLPAWERVERGLEELQACHAEVVTQPTSVSPRLKRALLCVRLGLWENAHEDLREALRLNKRVLTPLVLLASLNPYEPNENEGLLTRSHPQLSSSPVLETWMSNHRSHGTEWNSLINKDEQVALSAGKESQELFTHLAERAYLVCVLGRPALALSEAKSLLERAPDNLPAHRIIIQALLAQKHVAAAGAALTQALQFAPRKADPEDLELQRLAGLVWQAQGRHAEAVEAFAACLAKIPSAELLQARAESLRYLQRFQEAAQDLAKAESAKAPEQKEQQP